MTAVHIGTMGWSYDFWKGRLYSKDAKPSDYLMEYSKHFNTVEADNTFYRVPSETTLSAWEEQTPGKFLFALKFPRMITHIRKLKNAEAASRVFLERARLLGKKLGPSLIQLPPNFGFERLNSLRDFLKKLPTGLRFAVEVRNPDLLTEQLYSLLHEKNVALAIVDGSFLPIVESITSDFVYVRWEGDRKKVAGTRGQVEVNRAPDIAEWAEKIRRFRDQNLDVFGYFSKYYSGYPPADVEQFLKLI